MYSKFKEVSGKKAFINTGCMELKEGEIFCWTVKRMC